MAEFVTLIKPSQFAPRQGVRNCSECCEPPWWRENSKEAYNSGLDALTRGLKAWSASRSGKRRGLAIAFPRFKARHRARLSCRFSTGAIRVDDRAHVVLPRIGRVKTHEPVTALLGKVIAGQARVLARVSNDHAPR